MDDIIIDPVEQTPEYLAIERVLEMRIKAKIGEGGYLGYCFLYWDCKKRILKEEFGIDWKSPEELNPHVRFD